MEKGCILPDNLVKELSQEGNIVLHSLARFCGCTKEDLLAILEKRNESEEHLIYGYTIKHQKIGSKTRPIRVAYDKLKQVQEVLKERLSYIPVSLAATGGKPGDSVDKNVEIHKKNPYLITLDIKDSYPSITTHRVYKKLQGAMTKPLKFRCSLIETDEQKDLFVRAVTHLCVSQDQLPQGASTSNQIQNIVMSEFDTAIEKKIPELSGSHIVYSRYADDMTISFPHFTTMDILKEKMESYIQRIKYDNFQQGQQKQSSQDKIQRYKENLELYDQEKKIYQENFSAMLDDFANDTFIVTDRYEFSYLQDMIEKMKLYLITNVYIDRDEREKAVGIFNMFKKNIKRSNWRIDDIKDEIMKIIGNDGRRINLKKVKVWTPQSNTDREINGMTFDREGNKGLSAKKKSWYSRFFDDLITLGINDLHNNYFYQKKFKIKYNSETCVPSIISTLNGMYVYMKKVYGEGKIPKDLELGYQKAVKKRTESPQIQCSSPKESSLSNKNSNEQDDIPF